MIIFVKKTLLLLKSTGVSCKQKHKAQRIWNTVSFS
jgi:hypothetical protein